MKQEELRQINVDLNTIGKLFKLEYLFYTQIWCDYEPSNIFQEVILKDTFY